jgi:hypothetical protein
MDKKLWRSSFVKTGKDAQAWLPDDSHIVETCMEDKEPILFTMSMVSPGQFLGPSQ